MAVGSIFFSVSQEQSKAETTKALLWLQFMFLRKSFFGFTCSQVLTFVFAVRFGLLSNLNLGYLLAAA